MAKKEGRYRRVRVGIWTDSRFRALPKTEPSARHLYWFLRTGPHTTMIPGVFQARGPGLADDLGWEIDLFYKCFEELFEQQLAFADWDEGLVFIPDVIEDESPRSINQIEGWRLFWSELPECKLKTRIHKYFDDFFREGPKSFYTVFIDVFGKPSKEIQNSLPKKRERTKNCDDTLSERTSEFIPEETGMKPELTVNSSQLTEFSVQSSGTSIGADAHPLERNENEIQNSLPKKPERTENCDDTNVDKPIIRGKKKNDTSNIADDLKGKKSTGNKNKKASDRRTKLVREKLEKPVGDLFALSPAERKDIVGLLEAKQDRLDKEKTRLKKKALDKLFKEVIFAYKEVKEANTGSGYFRLGEKEKEAVKNIGIGCVAYQIEPERLISYWAEHNFTSMKFPNLHFISSHKNIANAAAELEGGRGGPRKRKGYAPINERFEDDSKDDNEELQLLAEKRYRKAGTRKAGRRPTPTLGEIRDRISVTRGRRKDVGS